MSFFNGVNPQSVQNAHDGFKEFNIGDNDAYIKMVQEKTSNSGNPMLEITFAKEDGAEVKYYIVDGEWKLSKLKQLYMSFGIPPEDYLNLGKWLYKEGVVVCKPGEPYNGKIYNKVSYVHPKLLGQGSNQAISSDPPARPPMEPGYITPQNQEQSDSFADDIPF
jgi:hypothetical protein